jgi:citrate synthase
LWYGRLPNAHQLESFTQKFINNRQIPYEVLSFMMAMPKKTPPMEVLRTAVSALSTYDPEDLDNSLEANVHESLRLTASMPTVMAAWERIRNNQSPILPRQDLSHAANFLYMMTGKEPDPTAAKILDTCLILHADHGLNASTFAARVTASTLSDLHSAIVSAIGTLKGQLHGGANEQVMRLLLEIGTPDRADQDHPGHAQRQEKNHGLTGIAFTKPTIRGRRGCNACHKNCPRRSPQDMVRNIGKNSSHGTRIQSFASKCRLLFGISLLCVGDSHRHVHAYFCD